MSIPSERTTIPSTGPPHRPHLARSPAFSVGRPCRSSSGCSCFPFSFGVILQVLGLDPVNIIDSLRRLLLGVWDMGFDAIRRLWRYLVLGAAIVVPVWLIIRLSRVTKGR